MIAGSLRVDFAMNRGHEMIIDRENAIKREELDEVEIHMLQGQPIPKLLPVEWADIDGRVTFRYALSGKRMLAHRLQSQTITMNDYYSLLTAVIEALDDCQHYMLREDGFLLHEQFIFAGERLDDIGLAYVPLCGQTLTEPSVSEAVQLMAIRWIGSVSDPDGSGLQRVLQHFKEERVSWNALRQTLLTLQSRYAQKSFEQSAAAEAASSARIRSGGNWPLDQRNEAKSPEEIRSDDSWLPAAGARHSEPASPIWPDADDQNLFAEALYDFEKELQPSGQTESATDDDSDPAKDGRSRLIPYLLLAVLLGAVWRYLYLDEPSQTRLLLCAGITLLAAAGLLYYLKRSAQVGSGGWEEEDEFIPNSAVLNPSASNRHKLSSEKAKSDIVHDRVHDRVRDSGRFPLAKLAPDTAEAVSQAAAEEAGMRHQSDELRRIPEPSAAPPIRQGDQATGLLAPRGQEEATVLLDGSGALPADCRPWLEREEGGQVAHMSITAARIVIGRSEDSAQIVDAYTGISRAHVEIAEAGESWSVKDIGSRNGSTFNGAAMIPYKAYTLKNGDVFQLAGERGPKYIFHLQA